MTEIAAAVQKSRVHPKPPGKIGAPARRQLPKAGRSKKRK